MCLFFHDYVTISKGKAQVVFHIKRAFSFQYHDQEEEVITEIQKCTKCAKRRGLIKTIRGTIYKVDPDFIEE